MKPLQSLIEHPESSETLRNAAMEVAQFVFTRSQENLVRAMPWGDDKRSSSRAPTIISDQSGILLSGVVPHWTSSSRIEFGYTAPHSSFVESGTDPHPVAAGIIQRWVARKLGVSGKEGIRAGFAIANAIRKRGIPPHPFLRPAIDEAVVRYSLKIVAEPY